MTRDPKRRVWTPCDTNRKHMTVVEAVSAKGAHTAPMIIASGKLIQERWFDNNLPGDTVLGVSESGYMNDEVTRTSMDSAFRKDYAAEKARELASSDLRKLRESLF